MVTYPEKHRTTCPALIERPPRPASNRPRAADCHSTGWCGLTDEMHGDDARRDAREFEAHRGLLFSIAYRMLGSATDAEDVVQDAWLRYSSAPPQPIRSPRAWLGTIVTRLCLDRLKAARTTRELYVGPWLPEPMLHGDREPSLARAMEQRESISLAFLVLLESLTPHER